MSDISYDITIDGKEATSAIKQVSKEQDALEKQTTKSTKQMKTDWRGVGVAVLAVGAAMGVGVASSMELERVTFNLSDANKDYVRTASEVYGISQDIIAGFAQTAKSANLTDSQMQKVIDQSIALGRAYPNESTEEFINSLIMLNKTGEAEGYVVDILKQKYGEIDMASLSLAKKQEAITEATKGVNERFKETTASKFDTFIIKADNALSDLGSTLEGLLVDSGALTVLNKTLQAINLSVQGYRVLVSGIKLEWAKSQGEDVKELQQEFEDATSKAKELKDELMGDTVTLEPIKITTEADTIPLKTQATIDANNDKNEMLKSENDAFFEDYKRSFMTAQEYELDQLNKRYLEYQKHVTDKAQLEEWFANEQMEIMTAYSEYYQKIAQVNENIADSISSSLVDATKDGELTFNEFAQSVMTDIRDIIAELGRLQLKKAILSSMGGFDIGSSISGGLDFIGAFAKGGVVNSPTTFTASGGVGLMGEAGSEAIMPLRRDSSGNMGVGAVSPIVNVNVENYGNDDVSVNQDGDMINVVIAKISDDITRGRGVIGSTLENRYGLVKR